HAETLPGTRHRFPKHRDIADRTPSNLCVTRIAPVSSSAESPACRHRERSPAASSLIEAAAKTRKQFPSRNACGTWRNTTGEHIWMGTPQDYNVWGRASKPVRKSYLAAADAFPTSVLK